MGKLENVSIQTSPKTAEGLDMYEIEATGGHLTLKGSSPSAICYAMDKYLRDACGSMICWSGSKLDIPNAWPDWKEEAVSPYGLRYFLNVCTFGYTAPYWNWDRWSQEIDWMALHGVNMPLASVAAEAIAKRVWLKLGLEADEIDRFFTGAAHLPWHRMGNLNSFDGPLNDNWHKSQVKLQHKILDRMRELGMEPVAPAFAGFIPPALMKSILKSRQDSSPGEASRLRTMPACSPLTHHGSAKSENFSYRSGKRIRQGKILAFRQFQ